MNSRIVSIEQAISDIRNGKMIILVDDEDRENEGDLCCAAESITPEIINFMAVHGRGLVCMTLTEEKADELNLNPMVQNNDSSYGTAFTVSIDAAAGISTGISAHDRARTILAAVAEKAKPEDLVCPGHTFPLRARHGGVLVRPGQTEGSVDLARLAGMHPAGAICEIMNEDGTMARMPELTVFAQQHDLNIVTIADLIKYRMAREKLIKRSMDKPSLPRPAGDIRVAVYRSDLTPDDSYVALIKGDITSDDDVLVRIHRECFLGDFMDSQLCDCGRKLKRAREIITAEGKGVLLYIRPADGTAGFQNKDGDCCTRNPSGTHLSVSQDLVMKRELLNCAVSAKILADLGISMVRSITSEPEIDLGFETYGLNVTELVTI